jgi:hypothetical protein
MYINKCHVNLIIDDLESSINVYSSSIGEAGGMSSAYKSLQTLLSTYTALLHPQNEMFFHIYLPLINCCNALVCCIIHPSIHCQCANVWVCVYVCILCVFSRKIIKRN